MVRCPVCSQPVKDAKINEHLDSDCTAFVGDTDATDATDATDKATATATSTPKTHAFFCPPGARTLRKNASNTSHSNSKNRNAAGNTTSSPPTLPIAIKRAPTPPQGIKRPVDETDNQDAPHGDNNHSTSDSPTASKRARRIQAVTEAMPLAERMRPSTLDHVCGQALVAPGGILRGMVDAGKLPSMILWGRPGTGKTTIARLIANTAGARFVEINSTSTKLDEVRRIFAQAATDLQLAGRKTVVFCDELHRFSKTQQDAFLGPVEAGTITLIAATTENPSFKVISALLSRCRTFTLDDLGHEDLVRILERARAAEHCDSPLLDAAMLAHFARFSDGDARTALNLLDLAISLAKTPDMTRDKLLHSLTKTLVYDRAGDQHYDSISALHKSIRGSHPDAALYYLARMLESGEDPRYIARRLVVVASEDVGLADNSMLSLATATYTACEKIGMPECRINLAHAVVALALAPKSTRAYRAMSAVMDALKEPGIAALPIPRHLRNAPTRLMKEMGHGEGYKYNPHFLDGKVKQDYLPEAIKGRTFLEELDLGTQVDADLVDEDELVPEIDD